MRNHEALLARVATWLRPEGRLFVHVFSHRRYAYAFERSWMARTFFSGGMMPCHDLLPRFQRDLHLLESWALNGTHYQRTAEAWLARLDENAEAALAVLADLVGAGRLHASGSPAGESSSSPAPSSSATGTAANGVSRTTSSSRDRSVREPILGVLRQRVVERT